MNPSRLQISLLSACEACVDLNLMLPRTDFVEEQEKILVGLWTLVSAITLGDKILTSQIEELYDESEKVREYCMQFEEVGEYDELD